MEKKRQIWNEKRCGVLLLLCSSVLLCIALSVLPSCDWPRLKSVSFWIWNILTMRRCTLHSNDHAKGLKWQQTESISSSYLGSTITIWNAIFIVILRRSAWTRHTTGALAFLCQTYSAVSHVCCSTSNSSKSVERTRTIGAWLFPSSGDVDSVNDKIFICSSNYGPSSALLDRSIRAGIFNGRVAPPLTWSKPRLDFEHCGTTHWASITTISAGQ